MTSPDEDDGPKVAQDLVTLARFGDLTTAHLLCGRLGADGISSFIPDEVMAGQTWHLSRAIGGIRVQVAKADLDRAKQILDQPDLADDVQLEKASPSSDDAAVTGQSATSDDDGTISVGDRAAFRALRVTLVSVWLLGLIHPYSLILSVRALGRPDLTGWGRWRAFVGLGVSLLGCAWLAFMVYRFAKIGG